MRIEEENPEEALKIYSFLANTNYSEEWHAQALLQKGRLLFKGNGVKKDTKAALDCYHKCYQKHKDPLALLAIGMYYQYCPDLDEKLIDIRFKLAAGYFKKGFDVYKEPACAFQYATLLYREKLPESKNLSAEDILKYIRPQISRAFSNPSIRYASNDALFLYGEILMNNAINPNNAINSNNYDEEFAVFGIRAFTIAAQQGDACSMLQLRNLYRHGLYVDKDIYKAESYAQQIQASEDTQANLVTKAYMYMRGDGVEQNKE
jgi:TPR repeat protein